MKIRSALFGGALALVAVFPAFAVEGGSDWNQWRGPNRNGIAKSSVPLAEAWPEEGPRLLWESEEIPSDHYGGHGSVAVADGKVYISLIWHRDVPTESRAIDSRVMSDLGYRGSNFSPELRAKFEEARLNRNPRLRGEAFEEWAAKWVEENFDQDQRLSLGSWAISRLRAGSQALSLDVFDKLASLKNKRFENHEAMMEWIDAQEFAPEVVERIVAAVPNTRLAAEDVVACYDAETGENFWKKAFASEETNRSASSTPAVVDGRIYAALRESMYCLDAESGELLWKAPLPSTGPASCPLVADGKVILLADRLVAYGVETGEKVWEQEGFNGKNASAVAWEAGGRSLVAFNSKTNLVLVDARTGELVWQGEGGGDGTPVVSGDHLVVFSSAKPGGLFGYRINESKDGLEKVWERSWVSRRKSETPIIFEGHVYLMGGERHVCIELESGEVKWEEIRKSELSSPALVDGKIFVLDTNGSYLTMLKATPEAYTELGRAKLGGLKCPSPAIADGKLFLRQPKQIACFDLKEVSS